MALSPKVNFLVNFLGQQGFDTDRFSIAPKDGGLTQVDKRSTAYNFFRWVIHLITFTLVPWNRALDRLSKNILIDIGNDINNATTSQKKLVETALQNLRLINEKNGGRYGAHAAEMLATIAKIKALPEVQALSHDDDTVILKEEEKKVAPQTEVQEPPLPKADSTSLRTLIQNQKQQEVSLVDACEQLAQLLPRLDETVPLSEDEIVHLDRHCRHLKHEMIAKLSPGLLSSLVKTSLMIPKLSLMTHLLETVRCVFLNKGQVVAFVKAFQDYSNNALAKEIAHDEFDEFLSQFFSDKLITNLKYRLSEDEIKDFIVAIVKLVVRQTTNDSQAKTEDFVNALKIEYRFGIKNTRPITEALCQVPFPSLLARVVMHVTAREFALKTILQANPPKATDPDDTFFKQLIENLDETHCVNLAAVFQQESLKRQEMVFGKFSVQSVVSLLDTITTQVLKNLDDSKFGEVVKEFESQKVVTFNRDKQLKALAKAMTGERLNTLIMSSSRELCDSILSHCDSVTQAQFVAKAIDSSIKHKHCLENVYLPRTVWEEASKLNPMREYSETCLDFTADVVASIVNGQIGNKVFLKTFFERYFAKPLTQDPEAESQKLISRGVCLSFLNPAALEFDKPEDVVLSTWYHFYKTLNRLPDQQKAKELLIHATRHLFNSPGFRFVHIESLYAMTREQLELLPIAQYSCAEMRLLIACLSNRLDDQLIDTANSLYDQKGGAFINFFEQAYTRIGSKTDEEIERLYYFAFKKNISYLKYFLTWLLDRPTMIHVLPTWTWLNDCYAREVLLRTSIQEDTNIQNLIKRHGLQVNKPS